MVAHQRQVEQVEQAAAVQVEVVAAQVRQEERLELLIQAVVVEEVLSFLLPVEQVAPVS